MVTVVVGLMDFQVLKWAMHTMPGYVFDVLLRLTGNKPILTTNFRKMDKSFRELRYFTTHSWKWADSNGRAMMDAMTEADRKVFSVDVRNLHWPSYIGEKEILSQQPTHTSQRALRLASRSILPRRTRTTCARPRPASDACGYSALSRASCSTSLCSRLWSRICGPRAWARRCGSPPSRRSSPGRSSECLFSVVVEWD